MHGRRLLVVSERGHSYVDLDDMSAVKVGRAPENDVVVKDDMVSRRHCQIEKGPGGDFRVRDLKSFNGTYLNERRVRDEPLGLWDSVRVGRTRMILVERSESPAHESGELISPVRTEDADAAAAEDELAAAVKPQADASRTRSFMPGADGNISGLLSNPDIQSAIEEMVRRERENGERDLCRRLRDESAPPVLPDTPNLHLRARRWGPLDGGGDFYDVFRDARAEPQRDSGR